MIGLLFILIFSGLPGGACQDMGTADHPIPQLELVQAYPIDADIPVHLSGLTLYNGHLLTVSDKHSDAIYEIEILEDSARCSIFKTICLDEYERFDFEGITVDSNGEIYVLCEGFNRVLAVNPETPLQWKWATPGLKPLGDGLNLMRGLNTGLEGLTFMEPDLFVACAERGERGFISWRQKPDPEYRAINADTSRFYNTEDRNPDFTGLFAYNGKLVVVQRNNHLISVVEGYRQGEFEEVQAWSFRHIELDPSYSYNFKKYGLAEGLAIDDQFIYLVLDHNQDARDSDPNDRRALLFKFKKPTEL